jgi:S-methylmethionine-dependent homocysteine/selenocysteine methylase
VVIAFTVETDGRLPDRTTLGDAITAVDAATDAAPAFYMVNCAHPTHFVDALTPGRPWLARIRGVRANASTKSHAVVGGCCGTDTRHVRAICAALQSIRNTG